MQTGAGRCAGGPQINWALIWTLLALSVGYYLVLPACIWLWKRFVHGERQSSKWFDGVGGLAVPTFPVRIPETPEWVNHPRAILVHVDFLMALVSIPELEHLKRSEVEYLQGLTQDILANDILRPLEVVIDSRGRVFLEDGLHRLAVADVNGIRYLPIFVRQSKNPTKRYNRPMSEVVHLLRR